MRGKDVSVDEKYKSVKFRNVEQLSSLVLMRRGSGEEEAEFKRQRPSSAVWRAAFTKSSAGFRAPP